MLRSCDQEIAWRRALSSSFSFRAAPPRFRWRKFKKLEKSKLQRSGATKTNTPAPHDAHTRSVNGMDRLQPANRRASYFLFFCFRGDGGYFLSLGSSLGERALEGGGDV